MNKDLKIVVAADHAGFALKELVKKHLEGQGYSVLDVGAHDLVPEDDYPVYMTAAAMKVAEDMSGKTRAVLFGGSGQGEAMVANRFPGVRAAVWYGVGSNDGEDGLDILKLSREHNDANMLSVGARFAGEKEAKEGVDLWLATPFSGAENHQRRIDQIDSIQ
jgi:ribose 5-phosphate isomerase B